MNDKDTNSLRRAHEDRIAALRKAHEDRIAALLKSVLELNETYVQDDVKREEEPLGIKLTGTDAEDYFECLMDINRSIDRLMENFTSLDGFSTAKADMFLGVMLSRISQINMLHVNCRD